MNTDLRSETRPRIVAAALLGIALLGSTAYAADTTKAVLSGAQEVPPVTTTATATSRISVGADMTVTGSIETSGVKGTAAHIHEGAIGTNGPVVVTLVQSHEKKWSVPVNTKLTPAQYESYKAGKLYVNVHSAAHPSGEVRTQLKP